MNDASAKITWMDLKQTYSDFSDPCFFPSQPSPTIAVGEGEMVTDKDRKNHCKENKSGKMSYQI